MKFVATTHHGNFREEVAFDADTEKEFKKKCFENVGYILGTEVDNRALRKVWDSLIATGKESYGWTDFVRQS